MVYEYALLTIDPARVELFEAAMPEAQRILLSVQNCTSVEFQHSEDRRDTYLMKVRWQHLDDHLVRFPRTPQAGQLAATSGGYFLREPIVAHFAN